MSAERHIAAIPAPLQPGVRRCFERLAEQGRTLPEEFAPAAARLVACSEFAANVVAREADWFVSEVGEFSTPADEDELRRFADAVATSDADIAAVKSELRRYRNRFLTRVLWREVQQDADLDETLRALSLLADCLLDGATRYATRQIESRFGQVRDAAGDAVPLVILGMGKLGGFELNFSSDIDVIFCYSANGESDGARSTSAQEYFARLSRMLIALIDEQTADGFVFRMDTRLRPFGDSGPPVVSFAALESYLLQHGRDWERYAYVKARIVGPKPPAHIADELCNDLIRPFVYRRYLDYGVFESVREMQELIAAEVRRRELRDNVKLGPGGIREAEFIVQALQLVRGGSEPALQSRELQKVLKVLVSHRGISEEAADEIAHAYRFLRRLENFIQAMYDRQTHDLPATETDRERLCLAMRFPDWNSLLAELDRHRQAISRQFAAIAFRDTGDDSETRQAIGRLWDTRANEKEWAEGLQQLGGGHAAALAAELVAFQSLSVTQQVDSVSAGRLRIFIPQLVEQAAASKAPAAALARALLIAERILRRSAYIALLNENHAALSKLMHLCAESQYIADQLARYPALLDELLDPRSYVEGIAKPELAAEVSRRLAELETPDSEMRVQVIAEFQRAAMFRIAVADFSTELPIMKVSDSLTWLAEVVLEEALAVAWKDLTERHGAPGHMLDGEHRSVGFGIVGYGKLGGLELSYGSDLDIVFLHDATGEQQQTDGEKPLDNTMFFSRLVRRLMHFLTTQTGSGQLYEIDTRLRPDGRSGLLVTNTEAFERYQVENAWTWEHQALLRARPVAGSASIAVEFERIRRETLLRRVNHDTLRDDVTGMRRRMRKELDRSDNERFDLKHGVGGIGDIEFLVQYLVLNGARNDPELIRFSDNIRQLDALVAGGILAAGAGERLQDIYRGYRLRSHRRVLDGRKAFCGATEFQAERDFVAATWKEWLG